MSITNERITELENLGFKRWTKGSMDRLYVNAEQLGLVCDYYNTGNICYATFNGEKISNCYAKKLMSSKTYIDIKTCTVYSDSETLKHAAAELAGIEQ